MTQRLQRGKEERMLKIELPMEALATAVRSVVPAASTDKGLAHMHGVCLEVRGGELLAMATDGKWLARYRCAPEYADSGFRVLVSLPYVKRLLALIGDAAGAAVIVRDKLMLRVSLHRLGSLEVHFGVAEVVFPSCANVWPTGPSQALERVGLNPRLMAALARAFKEAAGKAPVWRFAFRGVEAPVEVTSDEAPQMDAILMPCALRDEDPGRIDPQLSMFGESIASNDSRSSVERAVDEFVDSIPKGTKVSLVTPDGTVTLKPRRGRKGKS